MSNEQYLQKRQELFSTVGELLDQHGPQAVLEGIADYEENLHDVPGMSRSRGLLGLYVSGEIITASMRIGRKVQKDLALCQDCWREESECECVLDDESD